MWHYGYVDFRPEISKNVNYDYQLCYPVKVIQIVPKLHIEPFTFGSIILTYFWASPSFTFSSMLPAERNRMIPNILF